MKTYVNETQTQKINQVTWWGNTNTIRLQMHLFPHTHTPKVFALSFWGFVCGLMANYFYLIHFKLSL